MGGLGGLGKELADSRVVYFVNITMYQYYDYHYGTTQFSSLREPPRHAGVGPAGWVARRAWGGDTLREESKVDGRK